MDESIAPSTRIETDYLGEVEVNATDLFGVNAIRGVENLTVSSHKLGSEAAFVRAFALCKSAAALANHDLGIISTAQSEAIVAACDEMATGMYDSFMIVDLMEGSGGTSTNMNVNEVIANRAQQMMGGELGRYDLVHPNDHVNRSQSTNDVYPSAMKIATYSLLEPLVAELRFLSETLHRKSDEFNGILHLGRTCLQDAQPMTLGQPFQGYASLAWRLAEELEQVRQKLTHLPLGGTAVGTGFGAPIGYKERIFHHLAVVTGVAFQPASNPFDAMQNVDVFSRVSAELRTCATSLAKVASDLILLSSGPNGGIAEIELPAVQAGSSIMPGKINPVLPMAMCQIGFAVVGNDVCIAQASQCGQLEINHFEPVIADRLFDSIKLLTNGVRLFRNKCVDGIKAKLAANEIHLLNSTAIATSLIPKLGYMKVSKIVRESTQSNRTLLDTLAEKGILDPIAARKLVEESTLVVL